MQVFDLSKFRSSVASGLMLAAGLSAAPAYADEFPAFRISAPETLIAPGTEDAALAASATPATYTTGATSWDVRDLARALNYDPQRMFEFVHNNVELHPLFGLQKGARGATIDLSGTPFDQADLLVQLLRESIANSSDNLGQPVTSANYVYGTLTLNGADFTNWFGVSDARSACRVLAAGGFPARVNGSTNCSSLSGSVSTVEMRHLWVQATVGGQAVTYDPAYKTHTEFAGLDLDVAMGYSAGAASNAVTVASQSTRNGIPYVGGFDAANVESMLVARSNTLRATMESASNYDLALDEMLGGRRINPVHTNLTDPGFDVDGPGSLSGSVWTAIPNHYRTTLSVTVERCTSSASSTCPPALADVTFYVDEIYGERLALQPNGFDRMHGGSTLPGWSGNTPTGSIEGCQPVLSTHQYNFRVALTLNDATEVAAFDGYCDPGERDFFELNVIANHPYAAESGAYMDGGFNDHIELVTRAFIVTGFGDISPSYEGHLQRGVGYSRQVPFEWEMYGQDFDPPTRQQGTESQRSQIGASWLSQFTRMVDLQAHVANAHAQHHHSLGVVFAKTELSDFWQSCPGQPCTDPVRLINILDEAVLLSVDSGVSLTLEQDNASEKVGLDRSVAAMSAALEGSVMQQYLGTPAATSTSTRLAWAAAGPDAVVRQAAGQPSVVSLEDNDENSTTGFPGTFDFYVLQPSDYTTPEQLNALLEPLITTDGISFGDTASCDGIGEIYRCFWALKNHIKDYLNAGYTIIVPQDLYLGPGRRCESWGSAALESWAVGMNGRYRPIGGLEYCTSYSRGGAIIAYRDTGTTTEIAHVLTYFHHTGKGGGAYSPPHEIDMPSLPTAADVLGAGSDVGWAFHVNNQNASVEYSTGALVSTGTGGFPHELTFEMSIHSGRLGPDETHSHNWDVGLSLSGSTAEGMGAGRALGAAPTLVVLRALQDLYSGTSGNNSDRVRREIGAMLITNWWSRAMDGNVATVTQGTDTSQYLRWLETNEFLPPAGSNMELIQTGSRYVAEPIETIFQTPTASEYRPGNLVWHNDQISFSLQSPAGDTLSFEHWAALYHGPSEDPVSLNPGLKQGFRATQWSFPTGLTVDFTYLPSQSGCQTHPDHPDISRCAEQLTYVSNSVGRRLSFSYANENDEVAIGATDLQGRYGGASGTEFVFADGSSVEVATTALRACVGDQGQYLLLESGHPGFVGECVPVAQFLTSVELPEDTTGTPTFRYAYDYDSNDPLNSSWKVETGEFLQENGTYAQTQYFAAAGRVSGSRNGVSHLFRSFYDQFGNTTHSETAWGRQSVFTYDGLGRQLDHRLRYTTSSGYPEARYQQRTSRDYDQRHNVRFERLHTSTDGNGVPYVGDPLVTEYRYEDSNWPDSPTTVIDPEGHATTTTYHATFGYPLATLGAEGERTDYDYDPTNGLLIETRTKVSATQERVATIVYDPVTQLPDYSTVTGTGAPYTLRTDFDWTAEGWLEAVHAPHPTDPAQAITMRAQHDAMGRVERVDTADGRAEEIVQEFAYDLNGRMWRARTSGDGGTSWIASTATYTPTGRVATITDPDGDTSQYTYDRRDWLQIATDPEGRSSQYEYYDTGENYCERRAYGTPLEITYQRSLYSVTGVQTQIGGARSDPDHDCNPWEDVNTWYANSTLFGYDIYFRYSSAIYFPDAATPSNFGDNLIAWTWFNPDGTVDRTRNRAGQDTTFTYDASNRVETRDTTEALYSSTYDLTGALLTSQIDEGEDGSIESRREQNYDAFGRLENEILILDNGATSLTTSYEYDRTGNRTAIIWPDNYAARYSYDVMGRLESVCEDANGDGTCEMTLARYRYDDLGRMIRTDYHPTGNTGSSYILYAWQDDGDLDAMRHVFGSQTKDFAYDYNANGELTGTYASDASWLWSAGSARTINYAPANERNEMLSWTEGATTTTALYDANGNYRGNGVNDLAIHNSQNQLVSLAMSGTTASYQYGPMGRRIETTIDGTRTRFLHSGDMEIAELVDMFGQWKIKTRYIPGLGVDQRVAMINVNTFDGSTLSREYYHADRLGSVIAMAAENGSVTANYVYTPFGVEDYGASGNPFRYTGRRWDAQVGLYYYRARYYDPELGRFLETDPILYADQMNLYAYVGNNPLNMTDPTGMEKCADANCDTAYIESHPAEANWQPPPVNGSEGIDPNSTLGQAVANGYDLGPEITFVNDAGGGSTQVPLQREQAVMIEDAVLASGVDSININSTTGGQHSPTSHHARSNAVDINRVDGGRVLQGQPDSAPASSVAALQEALADQAGIRENFGPVSNTRTNVDGSVVDFDQRAANGNARAQNLVNQHLNHIHAASQACHVGGC